MRLRHFKLIGIRKLDGMSADLPRTRDTDLVVVHGGRSAGKTSFLDTLAACTERVAGANAWDSRWDSLPLTGAAKVALDWEASEDERKRMALAETLLLAGTAVSIPASMPIVMSARTSSGDDAVLVNATSLAGASSSMACKRSVDLPLCETATIVRLR